jgi:hypothetical protein
MTARPSLAVIGASDVARIDGRPVDFPSEFQASFGEAANRQDVAVRAETADLGDFGVRRSSGMPRGEAGGPEPRGSRGPFRMPLRSSPVQYAKNSLPPAHRHRRGAAAVEFALILPLLITIVLGCVDFGRFAYSYIALTNAARAGGAFGCMNVYTTATKGDWIILVQKAATDEMVQQTGYDPTKLKVTVTPIIETTGLKRVMVEATYPFKTIVNWPGLPTGNGTPLVMKRTVVLRAIRD